jgi:hypothetical protein
MASDVASFDDERAQRYVFSKTYASAALCVTGSCSLKGRARDGVWKVGHGRSQAGGAGT